MAVEKFILRLQVGHESTMLEQPLPGQPCPHTHRWTVFVRYTNNVSSESKLIEKVIFQLHDDFKCSRRVVSFQPFKVTETGYAGFVIPIFIQFAHCKREYRLEYDMNLRYVSQDRVTVVESIEFKDPKPALRRQLCLARVGRTPLRRRVARLCFLYLQAELVMSPRSKVVHYQHSNNSVGNDFFDLFGHPMQMGPGKAQANRADCTPASIIQMCKENGELCKLISPNAKSVGYDHCTPSELKKINYGSWKASESNGSSKLHKEQLKRRFRMHVKAKLGLSKKIQKKALEKLEEQGSCSGLAPRKRVFQVGVRNESKQEYLPVQESFRAACNSETTRGQSPKEESNVSTSKGGDEEREEEEEKAEQAEAEEEEEEEKEEEVKEEEGGGREKEEEPGEEDDAQGEAEEEEGKEEWCAMLLEMRDKISSLDNAKIAQRVADIVAQDSDNFSVVSNFLQFDLCAMSTQTIELLNSCLNHKDE